MRALRLLWPLLLAVALGAPVGAAQVADSVRIVVAPAEAGGEARTVTVPLPNGAGEFYYRAGPGGVSRFRPQINRPRPVPRREAVETAREDLGLPPSARPASAPVPVTDGVTRLDLLLLERDLLDAIDRRLARLPLGNTTILDGAPAAAPVIVLPGRQPAAPAPVAPAPGVPAAPPERPAPPVVIAEPSPEPRVETIERAVLETGLFRTSSVTFEFAQADLIPASAATLEIVADVLRRYPALRIEVGGHTDSRGSDATNDRLSQERAESVVGYLAAAGVARERLSAVGYGERRPIASNDTETGRALNRRVEFTVLNPQPIEPAPAVAPDASPGLRDLIRQELERLREGDGG